MSKKYSIGSLIWRVLYPFLVYMLVQALVEVVVAFGSSVYLMPAYMDAIVNGDMYQYMRAVMTVIYNLTLPIVALSAAITIPFMIWYMRRDIRERKEVGEYVKYRFPNILKLLVLIVLGLSVCFVGNVIINLVSLDEMSQTFELLNGALMALPLPASILCGGILGPIAEELINRGLIFKRLRDHFNFPVAALISALIFGVTHGNIVQGSYAFVVGLLMAFVYERYQTILAPMIVHVCSNTFAFILSEEWMENLFFGGTFIAFMVIFSILLVLSLCFVIFFVHPKKVETGSSDTAGQYDDMI